MRLVPDIIFSLVNDGDHACTRSFARIHYLARSARGNLKLKNSPCIVICVHGPGKRGNGEVDFGGRYALSPSPSVPLTSL